MTETVERRSIWTGLFLGVTSTLVHCATPAYDPDNPTMGQGGSNAGRGGGSSGQSAGGKGGYSGASMGGSNGAGKGGVNIGGAGTSGSGGTSSGTGGKSTGGAGGGTSSGGKATGGATSGGTSAGGKGGTNSGGASVGGAGTGGTSPAWRPFASDSPWNTPISASPSIDPQSAAMIADLTSSSQWPFLSINIDKYSIPIYWTDDSTPKVEVRANVGGQGFVGNNGMDATALIPIPAGAAPDPESDHHLLIIHRNKVDAWDFWDAKNSAGTWTCGTCAMSKLDGLGLRPIKENNPAWYTSHGSRACGFPLVAGLIRVEEIEAGRIEHALVIAYPHIRAGLYTPPASTAQARVGTESIKTRGVPCGGRIQLDPSLDLAALNLQPAATVIARALQEYGAYVGDYSGAVSLYAENGPEALAQWNSGLLDTYDLRDKVRLEQFRVMELGTLYDDHNGD